MERGGEAFGAAVLLGPVRAGSRPPQPPLRPGAGGWAGRTQVAVVGHWDQLGILLFLIRHLIGPVVIETQIQQ